MSRSVCPVRVCVTEHRRARRTVTGTEEHLAAAQRHDALRRETAQVVGTTGHSLPDAQTLTRTKGQEPA